MKYALVIADSFYIGVLDLAAATAWYIEKLRLQKVSVKTDDAVGMRGLGIFEKGSDSHCPRASWQTN